MDLRLPGALNPGSVYANLSAAELTELAIERHEGTLCHTGAFVAYTGARTGRSPRDRFIVPEPGKGSEIAWGSINQPMEAAAFDRLYQKVMAYLQGRELFVNDGWACADSGYRLNVRVISEKAWHALFAQCLFLRPGSDEQSGFRPDLTIIHASGMQADPLSDGTRSEVFVVLNLDRRTVLIGSTHYAGEIKKSVFSVLNYLLPSQGVFPMHCSANVSATGESALFFGLSGTGKTTLSADPERRLVGDDEHGWSDEGIFNFEGGCYAKTIRLSKQHEPQIWNAIRFGSVLENVVVDPITRQPDFDDARFTENTRAAYPVDYIDNCEHSGRAGHPKHILFLTCDAFGVLPPISQLTTDQALYHFLSGYTAKVAGTETGVTEPEATFSTCFAAPFLPLNPARYAELFQNRLKRHGSRVWLVNTGWTGGPHGSGRRMELPLTRAMLRAILGDAIPAGNARPDPIFGVLVPRTCPGVPDHVLAPRRTWSDSAAYDRTARHLAGLFQANFESHGPHVAESVRQAGPRI